MMQAGGNGDAESSGFAQVPHIVFVSFIFKQSN
jgi:hypothetical protein